MKPEIKYACPNCNGVLSEREGRLLCPSCDRGWEVLGGIADLGGDIPYYGEVPRDSMRAIVAEAKQKGWKKALHDSFFISNNFLYQIAAYETRADWLYLLDLKKEHAVLDVGSGWGSEAIPLARNAGLVAAMDGTLERLEFLMVRAAQEKADNIVGLRGSILAPPLARGQFDLVVLNGVLEWMGMADEKSDPLGLQKTALKNAFDLLKDDGRLYLSIENSHGFKYLLGEPDDHTGVRDITFLPREDANKVMRAVAGKDYRTYTHSYQGYKAMLEEAGFNELEFYYPMPDYKFFTFIAPLDRTGPYRYCREVLEPGSRSGTVSQSIRNLERAALEDGTLRGHVSSYSIIARKA